MNTLDQELINTILQEIDSRLNQGILPVHNGHFEHLFKEGEALEYLLLMKNEGLISGDLVTKGANSVPYRMTNIRLTYIGIRALSQQVDSNVSANKEWTHRSNTRKDD